MLLLWFFLFLFFDNIVDRQRDYIRGVGVNLMQNYDFGSNTDPQTWQVLDVTAKDRNMNIYVFVFDKNELPSCNYTFPKETAAYLYTPYTPSSERPIFHISTDSLKFWTTERQTEYLTKISEMNEETGEIFTYIEDTENSFNNTLFCGGKLTGNLGSGGSLYFCLIASISNNNSTLTLVQNTLIFASVSILIFSVILALIFANHLSKPINKLAATASNLASGDYNVNFEGGSFTEVEKLAASLNFAKDEMSKTEQMRRDFIANISHDLRTPLTMIRAYGEMIRDLSGNNEEKRTKHCQIIIDESVRLSALVADIQNLSKLQSGTDSFEIANFDLGELCKTVVGRFGIMSETQGYVFECDCEDNAVCKGDYQKIEQVLYNLIGNAVNYTGDDKKIVVRCHSCEDGYKVEIIDSGKGIAKEEIDAVWERYYRANQKKRNVVGSGLGLNIVKMILDGHKARFGIESELNVGTCFWFVLPKGDEKSE